MPRRNLYLLWFLGLFCLLCYAQSDPLGRVLVQTLRRIQWRYIEKVDDEKLFEGAVNGMVNRLERDFNDRYTEYVPPRDVPRLDETLNSEYKGRLGLHLGVDSKTGQLTVLSPIFGSPASLAGIQANDRVVAVNGKLVKGLSLGKAIKRMQGKVGKPVVLRIQRPKPKNGVEKKDSHEEFDVKLSRGVVKVQTVLGDKRLPDGSWTFMLEGQDKIGYLRIVSFTDSTAKEVRNAIDQLQKKGMKGLIIDLRDNPGGYLDSAVEICDRFIDSGTIVTTRGRSHDLWHWFSDREKPDKFDTRDEFFATAEGTLDKKFPIAILINPRSASASEIVAACLQDHHRAKMIGERSYGKGTVQEILPIGGGRGVVKLTAASYWRPSGKNIRRSKRAKQDKNWGVRPDSGFEVPLDRDTRKKIFMTRKYRDVNYNEAYHVWDERLQAEFEAEMRDINEHPDTKAEAIPKENGLPKIDQPPKPKSLPIAEPSVPMIDIDPQFRKAVEWIEKER